MKRLTADVLREVVTYDRSTGSLVWLHDVRGGFNNSVLMRRAGTEAGTPRKDGRVVVRINGKTYLRYRLVWLYENGVWPDGEIDHIDGDCSNDVISNLRVVSRRVNQENLRNAQKNKLSCNLLGVHTNPRNATSPWRALITVNGVTRYLGVFKTPEAAHRAYVEAKRAMHEGCTI